MITALFERIAGIRAGTDAEATVKNIHAGIPLRGYNLWMIICSAALASLGLDTNSTAVIIGAMLISPLMSPILGVGLALGTNDRSTLIQSVTNLGLATTASLFSSWLYFFLTPLGEATSEILARTQPTLLDVLVAFFGGIAGIVSGSRREMSNAIPGVAIATALMPPLCTAGFGLATGNWALFFGAFYLYVINSVFISIATLAIVKYLRFPMVQHSQTWRGMATQIALVSAVIVLPSVYFLYNVYGSLQEKRIITTLLIQPLKAAHNDVLSWEIVKQDTTKELRVFYAGREIDSATVKRFHQDLTIKGLSDYRLLLTRVNMSKEEVSRLSMEAAQKLIAARLAEDKLRRKQSIPDALAFQSECIAAFPFVERVGIGTIIEPFYESSPRADTLSHVILHLPNQSAFREYRKEATRVSNFCRQRLQKDTVVVITNIVP